MKQGRNQWINREEVQAWAIGYLERRKLRHPDQEPAERLYERLAFRDRRFVSEADKELLKLMRGAWSQKKCRTPTPEKKPASFVLSLKAARALKRLSNDWGLTKTMALEQIISDALKQENTYKTARKDEGIYKKRSEVLIRHLGSVLDELYEYKALAGQSGLSIDQRAASLHEARRVSQKRKQELMAELPASSKKKAKSKGAKRGDHVAEAAAHSGRIPSIYSFHSQEQIPSSSSLANRAGAKREYESNGLGAHEHNELDERTPGSKPTPQAQRFSVATKSLEPDTVKAGQSPHHTDADPDLSINAAQSTTPEQKPGWTDENEEELKKLIGAKAQLGHTTELD